MAADVDNEAAGKSFDSPDGTGRTGKDGDQQLVAIAGKQGFDGKPRSVSESEMDTLVTEKGHLELHRGVSGTGNMSAADVHAKFRGGDYYGGSGYFGNGTYVGPNKQRSEDFYSDGTKGSMMRMAARPQAKIVTHRDLTDEHSAWLAKQPKGSAQHSVFSDPGRYAAARGWDIIHVQRGGFSDEYIVLNRTSVIVQKA